MICLELNYHLLRMLLLGYAISLYLLLLSLEVGVHEKLILLSGVQEIHSIPLSLLVFLLPHFHKLPVAHLFLLVHLFLGFKLFRCRLGAYALLVLAKSEDFRLEKGVLDSFRKMHILLIIHTRVVLNGLLYIF